MKIEKVVKFTMLLLFYQVGLNRSIAQREIFHVDKTSDLLTIDGSEFLPYLNISTAVCNSNDGDIIKIESDNYIENLTIRNPLILESNNGSATIKAEEDANEDAKFNLYFNKACHNCYEIQFAPSIKYALCGTNNIEIDIYDTKAVGLSTGSRNGEWYVRHDAIGGNDNCCSGNKDLSNCLRDIKKWSDNHPNHHILTIFIDKKQDWGDGRRPIDLDNLITSIIPNDKIFKPENLKGSFSSLREATRNDAWPNIKSLEGKICFVLTGGKLKNHNKTQHCYVSERESNAIMFVAPDIDEVSDVLDVPDQFNKQTAEWVVFNNIEFGDEEIGALIKSMGYISRVWGADENDQTYKRLVDEYIHFIALYEFEEIKFNDGAMNGVKPVPSTHHHHERNVKCEHGIWATQNSNGHHHHKRGSDCIHGDWATSDNEGHHHHKRGINCNHDQWATDEQAQE